LDAATEKRAEKPSIAEAREQMARSGDVDGLMELLLSTSWSMVDLEGTFKLLFRAIRVSSQADPIKFSAGLFQRMLGLTSYLTFRTHYYAHQLVLNRDANVNGTGTYDLCQVVTDKILPRLIELQGHAADLAQAQAHTARLWEIALEKRAKNDRRSRKQTRSKSTEGTDMKSLPDQSRTEETHERNGAFPRKEMENDSREDRSQRSLPREAGGDRVGHERAPPNLDDTFFCVPRR
jgi:hypothetical protein